MSKRLFKDFYEAWWWLYKHPAFVLKGKSLENARKYGIVVYGMQQALDITVEKVNPETRRVDPDDKKNTHIEVWLEIGPFEDPEHLCHYEPIYISKEEGLSHHDIDLDCGGDTFEEAIMNLAELVFAKYGNGKDYIEKYNIPII